MVPGRALKGAALALTLLVAVATGLPLAMAGGGHGGGHGSGPVDPLVQSHKLFLQQDGSLADAPPGDGNHLVPAGQGTPVVWKTTAAYNGAISSSLFLEFWATSAAPNAAVFSPQGGGHFSAMLAKNGEPLEESRAFARIEGVMGRETYALRVFLPGTNTAFAKGDTIEIWLTFHGINPDANPIVWYPLGNEFPASVSWQFKVASLDELGHEHSGFPHVPLKDFPLEDLTTKVPNAVVINVQLFHWGYSPNPITVTNGTHVILRLYYDGEADDDEIKTGAAPHAEVEDGAVHGFSLEAYKKGLETRVYPGEVVLMEFDAVGPGEYMYFCTVFCGESVDKSRGHGQTMHGQLVIEKSAGEKAVEEALQKTGGEDAAGGKGKSTPGPGLVVALGAVAAVAVAWRRRAHRRSR